MSRHYASRARGTKGAIAVVFSLLAAVFSLVDAAETNSAADGTNTLAAAEKKACGENLLKIFAAIQTFQAERKDLPNWLSDLVPKYLSDANLLVCPTARRTGRIEAPPLADPNLSSSYLFEFCPVPLGSFAPATPDRTRREWKRRQMGMLGSVVPIVRCRNHSNPLNLSFDGKLYDSPAAWERAFSDRVSFEDLSPTNLFRAEAEAAAQTALAKFPARDKKAGRGLLDLTPFYNAALAEGWTREADLNLKTLPTGLQMLAGTQFDVRGVVQLAGKGLRDPKFSAQVKAIPVKQKCKRLHFLHATVLGTAADEGIQAASYVIRFSANRTRLEIPVIYGKDTRNLGATPGESGSDLSPVWTSDKAPQPGSDKSEAPSDPKTAGLRLYKFTWENIAPDIAIESVDLVSSLGNPAPLVIAITAE